MLSQNLICESFLTRVLLVLRLVACSGLLARLYVLSRVDLALNAKRNVRWVLPAFLKVSL